MLRFAISFFFFLNQSLDTLLPADLRSLNSASKRLEVRGYLSVCWDLFPAILLLCLIGLVFLRHGQSQFCKNFAFVFSRLITSDLLTPCCFATVLYLLSKRSSVFFYEIDGVGLSLVSSPWIASLPLSLTLHNTGWFTLLTLSHSLHVCFTWLVVDVYKNSQCISRCWADAVRVLCGRGAPVESRDWKTREN